MYQSVTCLLALLLVAGMPVGPLAGQASHAHPQGAAPSAGVPRDSLVSGATRTVKFETTQGTWMNVDVSPDGRVIIFDLLGDLYTVPIGGGAATRLTSGPAFDTEPVFSPDGKQIAFVSDRSGSDNIWLMDTDGGEVRAITHETAIPVRGPEWVTASDFQLVARKPDGYWLYRPDGRGTALQPLLGEGVHVGTGYAGWSRDGRFLYAANTWQWLLRLDIARGISEVVSQQGPRAFRPMASPDGQWLVFASQLKNRTGLRLLNLATLEQRWLRYPLPDRDNSMLEGGMVSALPRFAFTPDSRAIILATGGTLQRLELRSGRLQPIRFRAMVEQELRPAATLTRSLPGRPDSIRVTDNAQYDRVGTRTVFSALGKIWIRDGGEPARRLMAPSPTTRLRLEREPVLSPDGEWVAFVSWHDVEGGQLWRVATGGGTPWQLTRLRGVYRHPVWSPDGSVLAVVREEEHPDRNDAAPLGGQIYLVPASGGTPRRVGAIAADQRPVFAADGKTVVTASTSTAAEVTPITVPVPRATPSGSVALEGATVITMRGDEVLRDATVLVAGGRIAAVGPRDSVALPAGTRRIDVSGTTIIPGLIDLRAAIPLARDRLEGTNLPLAANLAFGVTTVRSFVADDGASETALGMAADYAALLETGAMTGARLLAGGTVTEAHAAELTSLAVARALVRRQQALGATALVQRAPLVRRQRQWLATAAREAELPLIGESGTLRHALTLVLDGYHTIQGTIPNAQLYADVRHLLAAARTVYVPTLLAATGGHRGDGGTAGTAEEYFLETTDVRHDPLLRRFGLESPGEPAWRLFEDYHFPAVGQQAVRLAARGTPVVVGTAGKRPGLGVHWEMWALEMGGFSPHDVLRAATATAAAALGLDRELGTIEIGKVADLVVVDGDPLTDLRRSRATRYVMKGGVLFEATTLAMLWPRATPPLPLRETRYDPPPTRPHHATRSPESTR